MKEDRPSQPTDKIEIKSKLLKEIKFQEVLEVRVNQDALNRNFQIIAECLHKINDVSVLLKAHQQQIGTLKQKTNKSERQIHTIQKGMELRKQFDLNKLVDTIDQHQKRLISIQQTANKHSEDIVKLYDLPKYIDYQLVTRNIDALNYFARNEQTQQIVKLHDEKLKKLQSQKLDIEKCQKDLKKYVQQASYKSFYEETTRELIRLEKDKLSHFQFQKENEKTIEMQNEMSTILSVFDGLKNQVDDYAKFVMSIDLKEIESKIKKSRQQLQYQINTLKPAVNSKVSTSDLQEFQKVIVQRLEGFLTDAYQSLAEKHQTKRALVFLEKRINQVIKLLNKNSESPQKDEELDAILMKTTPWHCASCSSSLQKVSSRPPAFTPWANFPIREHQHEKDKNFQTFLDKLALKRLSEPFLVKNNADEKLQLLADAISNLKEKDADDPTTSRTTNFMHNYGRAESRSMVRVRSSKIVLHEPKQRRSETKRHTASPGIQS